jgi:hypothetical protein
VGERIFHQSFFAYDSLLELFLSNSSEDCHPLEIFSHFYLLHSSPNGQRFHTASSRRYCRCCVVQSRFPLSVKMKEITEELLLRASKSSPNDIKTLILRRIGIGGCGATVLSHVECVDLSNNDLQTMLRLFQQFPSGWWFNLSGNTVRFLS